MMNMTHNDKLTWRQATARIVASVALGLAIAAVIASSHGSASAARADPAPPGTAASELDVLLTAPIDETAPSGVEAGFAGASADADGIRLLGHNAGRSRPHALRLGARQRRRLQRPQQREGGGRHDVLETLPPEGITVSASDIDGWTLYGFAANDVVGVDVVLGGKPQPATMLKNGYAAASGPPAWAMRRCSSCTTPTVPWTRLRTPCELPALQRRGRALVTPAPGAVTQSAR